MVYLLTQAAATWTSGDAFQQQHGGLHTLLIRAMAQYGIYRRKQQLRRGIALRLNSGYHSKLPRHLDALRFALRWVNRVAGLKPIWVAGFEWHNTRLLYPHTGWLANKHNIAI